MSMLKNDHEAYRITAVRHVLAKSVFLWSNSDTRKIPFMKQLWQFDISLKSYSVLAHDKLTGSITTNLPIRGQLD